MKEMSRRDLFKIGGVAAAGAMGASMLAGCSPSGEKKSEGGNAAADDKKVNDIAGHYRAGTPSFLSAPDPITDIKETKEYDVVIVGAGAAGVPAAISAKEAGATVALIQKEATAISQGNTATGILLDGSDPAGVSAVVSTLLKEHQFRGNRAQVELWADYVGLRACPEGRRPGFRYDQKVDLWGENREWVSVELSVHRFRPEAL